MKTFREWLQAKEDVQGYRGVGPEEIRKASQGAYSSPTMRSGDVYFDTGPDAHDTAVNYVNQGGGGDPKLGAKQVTGKGYVMGINAPDDVAHRPDFAKDTGHDVVQGNQTYQAVPSMKPEYLSTIQSVRPNPQGPMNFGSVSIARPPIIGKPRDAQRFMQTYNRMFKRG